MPKSQVETTEKYRFLKHIYQDDWSNIDNLKPDFKNSNPELAKLANDFLKRPEDDLLGREAIRAWRHKRFQIRSQAEKIIVQSKHSSRKGKKVKRLQNTETFEFCEYLFKHFEKLYDTTNLTYEVMVNEARNVAESKFPNIKLQGRVPAEKINLDFIRDQCRSRGWFWKRIMGKQRVLDAETMPKAERELAAALEGYSDNEISNMDESPILLNDQGNKSMQPPVAIGPRTYNGLDPKSRLTIMVPINKSGKIDFPPLFIDKNVDKDLKRSKRLELLKERKKTGTNNRLWSLSKEKKNKFYLGITSTAFIRRVLFKEFVQRYDNYLGKTGQRRALIVDNLKSHVLSTEHKKQWQRQNPDKICYIDDVSFKNVKLCFLPPMTTATCQPSDLGMYAVVQARTKKWLNLQPDKFQMSRTKKIDSIREIIGDLSKTLLVACWRNSQLKCLHPKEFHHVDNDTQNELEESYKVHSDDLRSLPVEEEDEDLNNESDNANSDDDSDNANYDGDTGNVNSDDELEVDAEFQGLSKRAYAIEARDGPVSSRDALRSQGTSGLQSQPGPSGLQSQPGPSGLQSQPGPSGLQSQPGSSGSQSQPGPSGLQSQPGPSGSQSGSSGLSQATSQLTVRKRSAKAKDNQEMKKLKQSSINAFFKK